MLRLEDHDEQYHTRHLCSLVDRKQMLTVARLAKDGKYICALCGRVAVREVNLCAPLNLDDMDYL